MVQVENIIEKGSLTALFQANTLLEDLNATPDVNLTTEKTNALNLKRHNLTLNDMADKVGLMETNSTAKSQKQLTPKDEKQKQNLVMSDFLIRLEAARQSAQDMHNLIDMRLEQINIDLSEAQIARDTLQQEADIVSDALDRFEATGQFGLNEDGTFKNDVLESAIQDYEAEHGEIDRDNTALLDHILSSKLEEYSEKIGALDSNIEQLEKDKIHYTHLDEKLNEAESKMNSDDPNMQQDGMDDLSAIEKNLQESLSVNKEADITSNEVAEQHIQDLSSKAIFVTAPKF
ncbi:hypothetical protein [Aquimarina macrocephali]|uniref:hypothetical protein n=1 Tax=Aquimarina macrocephali TaxID=666563 RepID=UPI0004661722|nr:hypothetical protein [Aquimarina macrocephali]